MLILKNGGDKTRPQLQPRGKKNEREGVGRGKGEEGERQRGLKRTTATMDSAYLC